MTPEAVIYRCLQLGADADFDAGLYAELIAADADLAAHWYGLLQLDAAPGRLQAYLDQLDNTTRQQLIQAQRAV